MADPPNLAISELRERLTLIEARMDQLFEKLEITPRSAEDVMGNVESDAELQALIASGKSMPAKMPDGKVIHVPYTDLVTASGVPRPANEIWDALVKAGVPRYAEIISFSDDPGEAAANYFILKLMGYPDVKVWML